MSGHLCPDCQRCASCGRSAWCEGDRILVIPCEHHGYCGDCNIECCQDCRLEAEQEMYDSGEYDPRADPFYDHTANPDAPTTLAEVVAAQRADSERYKAETGFDGRTNTRRPR